MRQMLKIAERAARSGVPVLILGETGVGKELIARFIHLHSPRHLALLIPFNCAAVPKELFESHLFGHKQGAFTGANRDQPGIIRDSAGGTLFLDEIGDLPLELQPKLLRFLQEGEIHTLGENRPSRVDVRILASTNSDLACEVEAGRFRMDLYHRLNVICLRVPPLRDRREDIPLLVNFFLEKYSRLPGNSSIQLTDEALIYLAKGEWQGNVRELSNLICRLVTLADGDGILSIEDLRVSMVEDPSRLKRAVAGDSNADMSRILEMAMSHDVTLAEAIDRLERVKVRQAFTRYNGNYAGAARELGLSIFGLRKKYQRLFPEEF